MNKEDILDEIFQNDPFGMLEVKAKNTVINSDERLKISFEEINEFYEEHNKLPEKVSDIKERNLFSRLKGINENPSKIDFLKQYDKYNILKKI